MARIAGAVCQFDVGFWSPDVNQINAIRALNLVVALNQVAVFAASTFEDIRARTADQDVIPAAPFQGVVALPAQQTVVAVPSFKRGVFVTALGFDDVVFA